MAGNVKLLGSFLSEDLFQRGNNQPRVVRTSFDFPVVLHDPI